MYGQPVYGGGDLQHASRSSPMIVLRIGSVDSYGSLSPHLVPSSWRPHLWSKHETGIPYAGFGAGAVLVALAQQRSL